MARRQVKYAAALVARRGVDVAEHVRAATWPVVVLMELQCDVFVRRMTDVVCVHVCVCPTVFVRSDGLAERLRRWT